MALLILQIANGFWFAEFQSASSKPCLQPQSPGMDSEIANMQTHHILTASLMH